MRDSAVSLSRRDPTGTYKIRRAFSIDFNARLSRLKQLTRELLRNDHLGLGRLPTIGALNVGADPNHKLETFSKWFRNAIKTMVVSHDAHWIEPYVGTAYRKGSWDAARHLGPNARPEIDPKRVAVFLKLAANEVDGLGDELERQVVREAGAVITAGGSPSAVMRVVSDRIEKVGIVRANAIVNVTIVSAHANASLAVYANAGLKQVGIKPEFVPVKLIPVKLIKVKDARYSERTRERLAEREIVEISTAGDDAVCDECQDLEDNNPYSIDEAMGLIPAHPNCRCAWVPAGEYEPEPDLME